MATIEEARLVTLKHLSTKVRALTTKLDALNLDKSRKWKWNNAALSIVQELRSLAASHLALTRCKLDMALEFPSAELTDPTLFIGGKPGFEAFNRSEMWFDEMGFQLYTTPYTFSDSWDHAPINATFLVPQDLDTSKRIKIVIFFHGGGFCTGAGDFVPWYSKASVENAKANNAIIIAPDYPLGPEASYLDLSTAISQFLLWYKEDGCFETGTASWRQWLTLATAQPNLKLNISENHIVVEGESAGGHAAVTAMFANADKESGLGLLVDVVFLRYPMIKHYARELPLLVPYMNTSFPSADIVRRVQDIRRAIDELEDLGLVPTRSKDHPPHGMSAAFLLSTTQSWQKMFQRHAGKGTDIDAKMDGLERAVAYAGKVDEELMPVVVMYHGDQDANCPISDTKEFYDLLIKHYPDVYREYGKLWFETVTKLEAQPTWNKQKKELEGIVVTNVQHGFDYSLDRNKENFLQNAYEYINKCWG